MSEIILHKLKNSKKSLFVGVAGPGTGKTTAFKTIVESIDYKDKKILILSFINKLISDLSNDFKDFQNVEVLTLHKFAKQKLGEVDLNEDLDKVISEDFSFINGGSIEFNKKFYENELNDNEEQFYKERKEFYKHKKGLYSFNSIIYAVNKLFKKHENKIPQFDLVLVDEFQDFNKSEWNLISYLNKKSKIVIVGDDDQSLYGEFRNAQPKQIRELFNSQNVEKFSLDDCYRCTRVIVNVLNKLIAKVKGEGYLKERLNEKKFLYPENRKTKDNEISKDKISEKYDKIDFIQTTLGDQLIYKLAEKIKTDLRTDSEWQLSEGIDQERQKKKRILIIVPSYLKQTIYTGLLEKGFNLVEFELFLDEECNKIEHKKLIDVFHVLTKRKTDNLSLRNILSLYLSSEKIKEVINKSKTESKKLWYCLAKETKCVIEKDIEIFKKSKMGANKLNDDEIIRLNNIFTLKNLISKMLDGFPAIERNAIEVEMTTAMSSKGLSADFVYYIGIDDENLIDKKTKKFTDQKICEFIVSITRTKEKLTLISLKNKKPKILEFIDKICLNEC